MNNLFFLGALQTTKTMQQSDNNSDFVQNVVTSVADGQLLYCTNLSQSMFVNTAYVHFAHPSIYSF